MDTTGMTIKKGDRIFATIIYGGKTIGKTVMDSVSDMSEVIREVKPITSGYRGFARIHIRNASRGQQCERMLSLTPDPFARKSDSVASMRLGDLLRLSDSCIIANKNITLRCNG